jgi:hypothetical protein
VNHAVFQNRTSNFKYRTTDFAADPAGNCRPVINAARGRANGLEASTENLLNRVCFAYYPSPGRLASVRLRVRL